jgi:ABC-2 type transport system ATP-binding protein
VAIIDHGKILVCDTPAALKRDAGGQKIYDLRMKNAGDSAVMNRLKAVPGVTSVEQTATALRVFSNQGDGLLPRIVEVAGDNLRDISVHEPSLETVFIKLTGRDLRE